MKNQILALVVGMFVCGCENSGSLTLPYDVSDQAMEDVPSEAFVVYDATGEFPYMVWTDPVEWTAELDPNEVLIEVFSWEGQVSKEGLAIGGGSEEGSVEGGVEPEIVNEPCSTEITLMFAYVGEEPISGTSFVYDGELPEVDARSCTDWAYGTQGVHKRVVAWGDLSITSTATFQHRHTTGPGGGGPLSSYHTFRTVNFTNCSYGYDCQSSNMRLRAKVCSSANSGPWFDFYTNCRNSCFP